MHVKKSAMTKPKNLNNSVESNNPYASTAPPQNQFHVLQQQEVRTIFDPVVVEHYERIVPGAAARILAILEKNNDTERLVRDLPFKETKRRDWMGFTVTVSILIATCFFAYLEKPWLYGTTLTVFLGIVIKNFLPHKKS